MLVVNGGREAPGGTACVVVGMTAAVSAGAMTLWSTPKDVFESDAFQKIGNVPGTVTVSMPLSEAVVPEGVTVISDDDMFRGPGTVGGEVVHKSDALSPGHYVNEGDLLVKIDPQVYKLEVTRLDKEHAKTKADCRQQNAEPE